MSKSVIVASAVALLVGVGVGASTGPEPEIVTKTVAGPTIEVVKEVPGPTKTVEKIVEKKVAPEACMKAITTARAIAGTQVEFIEASGGYPPLVAQAFEAGLTNNSSMSTEVVNSMRKINERMNAATAKVGPQVETFNAAASDCE